MMGDQLVMQESLFYEFCLDQFVARSIGSLIFLICAGISGHSTARPAGLRLIPS
jgi:hypothetical protein